jgi:hypothetical protein
LNIKDSLKEDRRLFDGGGGCLKGNCWREIAEGGKITAEGRIVEGKRIAEGELLRGIAKEGLIELVGSLQGDATVVCLQV